MKVKVTWVTGEVTVHDVGEGDIERVSKSLAEYLPDNEIPRNALGDIYSWASVEELTARDFGKAMAGVGSPSAGSWWQEHVGHNLEINEVHGYSPVWGRGKGYELRCATCPGYPLLDEFASVEEEEEEG